MTELEKECHTYSVEPYPKTFPSTTAAVHTLEVTAKSTSLEPYTTIKEQYTVKNIDIYFTIHVSTPSATQSVPVFDACVYSVITQLFIPSQNLLPLKEQALKAKAP